MNRELLFPDYVFESSWEVCNKVGGIYTVLSTRAKTLHQRLGDHLVFIGPYLGGTSQNIYFDEDETLLPKWKLEAAKEGLAVRIGRWNVPGNPVAILVDFAPFFSQKDSIYTEMWKLSGVDSLHAYGDYDEASMFSYAAAKVVESYYHHNIKPSENVVYQGHEWMTGLGLLYIKHFLPRIATIFTTHATSIGRSIAGNNKKLYAYLPGYNGDQMAAELNMQSKHSVEKQAAHNVDCFTTVSEITDHECAELLDKPADVVLPNGFENDFVPRGETFSRKRKTARASLFKVANALTGCHFDDDTLIVSTSGRYEFRNKGIDVFIEAINRLRVSGKTKRQILAFIEVPGWVKEPRKDLALRLSSDKGYDTPLENPVVTHVLNNEGEDRVLGMLRYLGMGNAKGDNVKIVFIPCYLNGDDGILNIQYYDLVLGNDLCVYPSYYEPWGYTPLEAIAFHVPCITTDLAGFGKWVDAELGHKGILNDGVEVVHRDDDNYSDVAENIKKTIEEYSFLSSESAETVRKNAENLSLKALWSNFIKYYYKAYDFALRRTEQRKSNTSD